MRDEVTRAFEAGQRIDEADDWGALIKDVARILEPFGITSVSTNLIMKPGHLLRAGMLFGHGWSDWSQRHLR